MTMSTQPGSTGAAIRIEPPQRLVSTGFPQDPNPTPSRFLMENGLSVPYAGEIPLLSTPMELLTNSSAVAASGQSSGGTPSSAQQNPSNGPPSQQQQQQQEPTGGSSTLMARPIAKEPPSDAPKPARQPHSQPPPEWKQVVAAASTLATVASFPLQVPPLAATGATGGGSTGAAMPPFPEPPTRQSTLQQQHKEESIHGSPTTTATSTIHPTPMDPSHVAPLLALLSEPRRKRRFSSESVESMEGNEEDTVVDGEESMEARHRDRSASEPSRNETGVNQRSPETDRKVSLERNRIAASKCRRKKKEWVQELEQRTELAARRHQELLLQNAVLKQELYRLQTAVLAHVQCDCESIQQYIRSRQLTRAQVLQNQAKLNAVFQDRQSPSVQPQQQ